ncbi:hypothetical protein IWZ00DRAFT_489615 [Phyllosticta capitalensis]
MDENDVPTPRALRGELGPGERLEWSDGMAFGITSDLESATDNSKEEELAWSWRFARIALHSPRVPAVLLADSFQDAVQWLEYRIPSCSRFPSHVGTNTRRTFDILCRNALYLLRREGIVAWKGTTNFAPTIPIPTRPADPPGQDNNQSACPPPSDPRTIWCESTWEEQGTDDGKNHLDAGYDAGYHAGYSAGFKSGLTESGILCTNSDGRLVVSLANLKSIMESTTAASSAIESIETRLTTVEERAHWSAYPTAPSPEL